MGKSVPVALGNGRQWSRKGDAVAHFKAILSKYAVGARIVDHQDHNDLLALLEIYDNNSPEDSTGKIGEGVAYFEKRTDFEHPGRTSCFFVVRTDGSSVDFSYLRAIDYAARL